LVSSKESSNSRVGLSLSPLNKKKTKA